MRYSLIIILLAALTHGHAQPTLFDILDGEDKVDIPFEYDNNFILFEVRLFGLLPMKFIFDTGAEHTILFKREYTDFLNVEYDLRIPIVGSDMSRRLYALVARAVDIDVEGLPRQKRDILVLEENYFHLDALTGTEIHGIIGGSFFKNTVIHIDYRRQRMTVMNPLIFEKPDDEFMLMPMEIRANRPYIQATGLLLNDTTITLDLLVDTGAGLPLLLHNNTHPDLQLPDDYILGRLGIGLGGYVQGYIGRIKKLSFGEVSFEHMLTSFQDLSVAIDVDTVRQRNGLIGNQILSRFDIYLDYVREDLYMKPRRRYKRDFDMDKSGLILLALGSQLNEFIVQDTIAGSPAARVDIRPGDILRRVQGFPSKLFSLNFITRLLQKRNGKKIRLVIQRDDEMIRKVFRLEELI